MRAAVLVEPEVPENTGFVARLCDNFGFELRLVNPQFNLSEARETANRSQQKLRDATIFETVEEAVEDLEYVAGTKPGRGNALGEFTPRSNTSVMLGRESSGLSNEELELCDTVVHIDAGEYSSLNLSHAAAILLHSFDSREEEKEGISPGQKDRLESLLPGTVFETLLEANPSRDRTDRIIGELEESLG